MDGRAYELVVARYLRKHHYRDLIITKASGDFGVDIIATKRKKHYAVQCKYYSGHVGVKAVQEAVAGKAFYDCDRAMVVTNSTFTRGAVALAKKNDVILVDHLQPGMSGRTKLILLSLTAIYLGVLGWGVYRLLQDLSGLGQNAREALIISRIFLFTCPLWILILILLLMKHIRSNIRKGGQTDGYIQDVENNLKSIRTEQAGIKNEPEADDIPVNIQKILDETGYDWDSMLACAVVAVADVPLFTEDKIRTECKIPVRNVRDILNDLEECGFIDEIRTGEYIWTYRAFSE